MKKLIILIISFCFACNLFAQTTYYSAPNQSDPNDLENWFTNTDSTGSHPTSFTGSGDIFTIQSGHTYTTDGDWTVYTIYVDGTLNIGAHTVDAIADVRVSELENGTITFIAAGNLKVGDDFYFDETLILVVVQ